MGVYFFHGIEYHIELVNGTTYIFLHQKDTDDRLEASEYYKARQEGWLSEHRPFVRPLETDEFKLSETEVVRLDALLETLDYKTHGWKEVNSIDCTL